MNDEKNNFAGSVFEKSGVKGDMVFLWDDVKKFLNTIFSKEDIIELRLINSKGKVHKLWGMLEIVTSDEYIANLKEFNDLKYNIYFGVNPRIEENKSGDANVNLCRCLFVDFDGIKPEDFNLEYIQSRIEKADLPNPTYIINSGHGFHCYWKLCEALPPEQWKNIQERLNETLGSDGTIKNPERIMRLPGFLNVKEKPFVECKIIDFSPDIPKLEDIEKCLVNSAAKGKTKEPAGGTQKADRPTWIEEELKRLDLINPNEKDISTIGEVHVISADPERKEDSYRTCMNIFTGRFYDFSHDAHNELEESNWREGHALKYFTGIEIKKRFAEGIKSLKYKVVENYVCKNLTERYNERFEKSLKEWLKAYRKAVEKHAKANVYYEVNEERLKELRELITNNKISDLNLNLKNPSKTAYFLYQIFYAGSKLIYRNDFETYGQEDAAGKEYKFYRIAD